MMVVEVVVLIKGKGLLIMILRSDRLNYLWRKYFHLSDVGYVLVTHFG